MKKVLLSVVIIFVLTISIKSATINVPGNQPTIQAGIDAALDYDTVLVAPGTYTGEENKDIKLSCRRILIRAADGPEMTIIDCEGSPDNHHRAFWIECSPFSPDTNATIEGFTIMDGYAGAGAGIYCYGSRIVVRDCRFIGNTSTSYGGGAGVVVPSTALFEGCLFANNQAEEGGGIFCSDGAWITASNCTFYGNSSPNGSAAAVMYGGILNLSNSIAAYSSEGEAVFTDGSTTTLTCCDLFGNAGGDWVGSIASQEGTNGNISADPYFCDEFNGNFTLMDISSCATGIDSCGLIGALPVGCDCCRSPIRGNIDGDPLDETNFADLVYFVTYSFSGGPPPPCFDEADIDGSGEIDITDIVDLVSYMFSGGAAPVVCP
ncbi:MAG TPA: hypothetical protein ENH23_05615 [candidate division Zixibacteria bacterium]|nr:hypothetical protein [candidate division Zixibacteria bacterium]